MRSLTNIIRALLRLIALIFTALGIVMLGFLVAVLMMGNGVAGQVLGRVWFEHDPLLPLLQTSSVQLLQVFFERKLSMPFLWHPGVTTLLNWPTWVALPVVAVILFVIGTAFFALARRIRR